MPCSKKFIVNLKWLTNPSWSEWILEKAACMREWGGFTCNLQSTQWIKTFTPSCTLHYLHRNGKETLLLLIPIRYNEDYLLFVGDGFGWLDWNIPTLTPEVSVYEKTSAEVWLVQSWHQLNPYHTRASIQSIIFNIHSLVLQKYFLYYIPLFIFKHDLEA